MASFRMQNHVAGSKEVHELGVPPSYMCAKFVYYLLRMGNILGTITGGGYY